MCTSFIFLVCVLVSVLGVGAELANNPLPHPFLGCPRIHYWNASGNCGRVFDSIQDAAWHSYEVNHRRVVTFSDDVFKCCQTSRYTYDYNCTQIVHSGADMATCVYADNYCFTMEVETVDTAVSRCIGIFDQISNDTWTHTDDSSVTLGISGRNDEGQIQFDCLIDGDVVGQLEDYECKGPEDTGKPDPLNYGLNNLLDEDTFVVGGDELKDGSFFKAFKISTPSTGDEWLKVWVLSPQPLPRDEVVVLPMVSNNDDTFVIAQLGEVQHATFRIRLVSSCSEAHDSEDVDIVMMRKGEHSGSDGQLVVADSVTIRGGTIEDTQFNSAFSETPGVFCHIQKIIVGPSDTDEGAMSVRIGTTSESSFEAGLEAGGVQAPNTPDDYEASVGYIAITSFGHGEGLFVPYTHYSLLSEGEQEATHNYPNQFDSTPIVISTTQTANGPDELQTRLVSSNSQSVEVYFSEDTCNGEDGSHPEIYALLAVGDYNPTTTSTTTSTTTTSITTTSTTTTSTTTTSTTTTSTTTTSTTTTSTTTTSTTTTSTTTTSTTTTSTTTTSTTTTSTTTTSTTTTSTTTTSTTTTSTTTTTTTTTTSTATLTETTTTTTTTTRPADSRGSIAIAAALGGVVLIGVAAATGFIYFSRRNRRRRANGSSDSNGSVCAHGEQNRDSMSIFDVPFAV